METERERERESRKWGAEGGEDRIETKAIGRLGRVTNSAYRSRRIRQDSLKICSRAPGMIQNSGLLPG